MLRKLFSVVLVSLVLAGTAFSQGLTHSVKVGVFAPDASGSGLIIGYEGGKIIDQLFTLGWSIDWYNKNYVDKALVSEMEKEYGVDVETNELRAKTHIHDIPLLFNVSARFPEGNRIKAYVTAGLGAEILIISYRNFENPSQDDLKAALDFSWRLGFGGVYEVSKRTDVLAELTYHSSKPSWEQDVVINDKKRVIVREYDMSGLMFRVGLKFYM